MTDSKKTKVVKKKKVITNASLLKQNLKTWDEVKLLIESGKPITLSINDSKLGGSGGAPTSSFELPQLDNYTGSLDLKNDFMLFANSNNSNHLDKFTLKHLLSYWSNLPATSPIVTAAQNNSGTPQYEASAGLNMAITEKINLGLSDTESKIVSIFLNQDKIILGDVDRQAYLDIVKGEFNLPKADTSNSSFLLSGTNKWLTVNGLSKLVTFEDSIVSGIDSLAYNFDNYEAKPWIHNPNPSEYIPDFAKKIMQPIFINNQTENVIYDITVNNISQLKNNGTIEMFIWNDNPTFTVGVDFKAVPTSVHWKVSGGGNPTLQHDDILKVTMKSLQSVTSGDWVLIADWELMN